MSIKEITILITSFKSNNKIRNCLNSINPEYDVINIENSSDREYKEKIERDYKNVKCALTGENIGYGNANNFGLKLIKTRFVLILNPDTEIFLDTIENFLKLAKSLKDFAIIGPNIISEKDFYKKTDSDIKKINQVKFVKGFAMLLNIEQFKNIGFFDKNIFFFLEEIDLCKRLISNNKKIYFAPNIFVFHKGASSHDDCISLEMELSRNWHWMWSSFYFEKKYNGYLIALIKILPKLFKSIIKMIFFKIIGKNKKSQIHYYRLSGIINSVLGRKSWYRPKV